MATYEEGSVHGRFQPLHNGHLAYILEAKRKCKFLWIGITQYNVQKLERSPHDSHREVRFHNPFTFHERVHVITRALLDSGLDKDDFDIIPFPIDTPECLEDFLPKSIPVLTTVYDDWNRHKIELLRKSGYQVVVLWEKTNKEIDGVRVRESILRGDGMWKKDVPAATMDAVEALGIRERLMYLREQG